MTSTAIALVIATFFASADGPAIDVFTNALLQNAQQLLAGILDEDSRDAEAFALLGTVVGEQITGAWKGMKLGRKADRAQTRAEKIAPLHQVVAGQLSALPSDASGE